MREITKNGVEQRRVIGDTNDGPWRASCRLAHSKRWSAVPRWTKNAKARWIALGNALARLAGL